MSQPEWGTKRRCEGCSARFYDLRRDPINCPKCGALFVPVAVASGGSGGGRSSRGRSSYSRYASGSTVDSTRERAVEADAAEAEEETPADDDTEVEVEAEDDVPPPDEPDDEAPVAEKGTRGDS